MNKLAIISAPLFTTLLCGLPANAATWSTESHVFKNIAATPAAFTLDGGQYGVTVHSTTFGGGSVTLQRLAADAATYVTCMSSFTGDGYGSVNLPAGTYQLTISTATGVYADITSVIVNK